MTPKQYLVALNEIISNADLTQGKKNHLIANLLSRINLVQGALRSDVLESIPYAKLYRHAKEQGAKSPELIYGMINDEPNRTITYTLAYFYEDNHFIRFKFKINRVDFDITKTKILSIHLNGNTINYTDITESLFNK